MHGLRSVLELGDSAGVQECLHADADVEVTYRGWSPLMKAAEEGHIDVMKILVEWRANLEAHNKNRRTALSLAAAPSAGRATRVEAVRLLLSLGADRESMDNAGYTPKSRTEKEGRAEVAALFDVKHDDAYMSALHSEMSVCIIKPAISPHTQAEIYDCRARFETATSGNLHHHGVSIGEEMPEYDALGDRLYYC